MSSKLLNEIFSDFGAIQDNGMRPGNTAHEQLSAASQNSLLCHNHEYAIGGLTVAVSLFAYVLDYIVIVHTEPSCLSIIRK